MSRSRRSSGSNTARSERGTGTMLMVGVMMVVLVVATMGVTIAAYLLAVHRARSAADLAALSGAVAYSLGGDACSRSRATAATNAATVSDCSAVGDQVDFVVSVRVVVRISRTVPGLPDRISAQAYAGSLQSLPG